MTEQTLVPAETGTQRPHRQVHPQPALPFSTFWSTTGLPARRSEKETIHIELELEEGMTYTPGDAVGIIPTNREPQVGR